MDEQGKERGWGKQTKIGFIIFKSIIACVIFLTAKSGHRKNKNLITVHKCFQKHLGYYESFIFDS